MRFKVDSPSLSYVLSFLKIFLILYVMCLCVSMCVHVFMCMHLCVQVPMEDRKKKIRYPGTRVTKLGGTQ